MDYGKILARAFDITLKHRALWLFGVLFAIFGGSGGNYNFGSFDGSGFPGDGRGGDVFPTLPANFWQNLTLIILLACCVVVVLTLVSIVARFVSRGALIGLVHELETAGTTPTVRRGFSIGVERFGSLLGIGLVINIPLMIFSFAIVIVALLPMILAILPLIEAGRTSTDELWGVFAASIFGSIVMICCAALLLIVIQLVVRPFYEFIVRVCVIDQRGVMDSLREGYRLVRENLGNVAVLYVLIIGVGIAFAILMVIVTLVLLGIPIGVAVAVGLAAESWQAAIILGICLGIPMVLAIIFISGLYQVFEFTLWTEGYLAITAPKQIANAPTI